MLQCNWANNNNGLAAFDTHIHYVTPTLKLSITHLLTVAEDKLHYSKIWGYLLHKIKDSVESWSNRNAQLKCSVFWKCFETNWWLVSRWQEASLNESRLKFSDAAFRPSPPIGGDLVTFSLEFCELFFFKILFVNPAEMVCMDSCLLRFH